MLTWEKLVHKWFIFIKLKLSFLSSEIWRCLELAHVSEMVKNLPGNKWFLATLPPLALYSPIFLGSLTCQTGR
jgi:hypothetical protein